MPRNLKLSVVCFVAVCLAAPLGAEDARELTIIASAQDSKRAETIGPVQIKEFGCVVIRSAKDLVTHSGNPDAVKDAVVQKEMEAELAKALGVEAIDWNKQMVLGVRGEPGSKADRVHFESLKVENKVLTVTWKVKQRPPHAGIGTPIALILVERFEGEVRFAP
jgi:hypothetical protein